MGHPLPLCGSQDAASGRGWREPFKPFPRKLFCSFSAAGGATLAALAEFPIMRREIHPEGETMSGATKDVKKVVLAYSGGLDTSVILKWLQETYGCEVVTFT